MSKRARINAEVQDLSELLKRIGASQVELADILNPRVHRIMMHPFTSDILKDLPEFGQVLADIAAVEKVNRLSGLDADEKIIDLGIIEASRRAIAQAQKKAKKQEDPDES